MWSATNPHAATWHACDAPWTGMCARTFLNADTSHWSSQGLRPECLLHIQGLHLHCGLPGSYTPFPYLCSSLLFSATPQTSPCTLFFLLFLLVRIRAFRYIRPTSAIADDLTKRSSPTFADILLSSIFSFRSPAHPFLPILSTLAFQRSMLETIF